MSYLPGGTAGKATPPTGMVLGDMPVSGHGVDNEVLKGWSLSAEQDASAWRTSVTWTPPTAAPLTLAVSVNGISRMPCVSVPPAGTDVGLTSVPPTTVAWYTGALAPPLGVSHVPAITVYGVLNGNSR